MNEEIWKMFMKWSDYPGYRDAFIHIYRDGSGELYDDFGEEIFIFNSITNLKEFFTDFDGSETTNS